MPIFGRTPEECFDEFLEHVRALVAATISTSAHVHMMKAGRKARVGFFQGDDAIAVPLDCRGRELFLSIGQAVEAEHFPKALARERYRLTTRQYWYRLQTTDDLGEPSALLRWEYDPPVAGKFHARHPIQIDSIAKVGKAELDLGKLHVPTGWVTIEEVIRFLINDLGHPPPCGAAAWDRRLRDGEERFFVDFTTKRYKR